MTSEPLVPLLREVEAQLSGLRPGPAFEARLQLRLRQEASARRDDRGHGRLLLLGALGASLLASTLLLDPLDRGLRPSPLFAPLPPSSPGGAASASASAPPPSLPAPDAPPPVDRPRADLHRVSPSLPSDARVLAPHFMEVPYRTGPRTASEEAPPGPPGPPAPQPLEASATAGAAPGATQARSHRASASTTPSLPLGASGPVGATTAAVLPRPAAVAGASPAANNTTSNAPSNATTATAPTTPSTAQTQPTPPPKTPTKEGGGAPPAASNGCFSDFFQRKLDVPPDEQSCEGPGFVRWSSEQNLWVGVVSCGDGAVRIYLSESEQGPFLPALDTAGHGQDHCELLVPGFTLKNEDNIASGSCASCSTGPNLSIEGLPGYVRSQLGEPFVFVPETGAWSYQTSRLSCGCELFATQP